MNIQNCDHKEYMRHINVDGEKHDKEIRNCLDAIYLLGYANTAMS